MAVGNIQTLQDVNFGALGAQQQADSTLQFQTDFAKALRKKGLSMSPQLYINEDGKSIGFQGSGRMLSDDELWNTYVKNAQSRRVKSDIGTFENEIKPLSI